MENTCKENSENVQTLRGKNSEHVPENICDENSDLVPKICEENGDLSKKPPDECSERLLGELNVEIKSKKFTLKQKLALIMLALAEFMCYCSMSIMAPFYPKEAANKGMTESMAGFVFGFYALVVFLSCPICGKMLPKVGFKALFSVGMLISGVGSILFGTLHMVDDYSLFTSLSFVFRAIAALGASAYSTAGYVIVINVFPDNAGVVRGLLETFVGLGLTAGPGIGGLLFAVGGFALPFYVIGILIIVIAPFNYFLLPSAEKFEIGTRSGSLTNVLKLPSVIMTCFLMVIVASTWGFLDPTLEPHLRKFQLSPTNIGLIFLGTSAMYGIFCPVWGWLTDKLTIYWWLMPTGLFANSVVLLILGPSPILNFFQDSVWLNVVCLSALGIFVAMALIPTYQFIVDSALETGLTEDLGTHSVIAGLWSSVYSLGEIFGPILGGTLMEHYGFPTTATTFSALNFGMAVCGTVFFLRRKTTLNSSSFLPSEKADIKKDYYSDNNSVLEKEMRIPNEFENIENTKNIAKA